MIGTAQESGRQMAEGSAAVRRRRVFYIPGYDPFPPRRYRELYRKEGAAQAAISGYALALEGGAGARGQGWQVRAEIAGQDVRSQIEVLLWSDIVRVSMGRSIAATYWQMLRTSWTYIGSGAIFRLARLRKGPTIAAIYPIAMLLAQLGVAVAVFLIVAPLVGRFLHYLTEIFVGPSLFGPYFTARIWLSLGIALLAAIAVLGLFKAQDHRLFAYYLMHDYAHSASLAGAYPPELEVRMSEFGAAIAAALAEDWDEVLVVGHSSGAHLAVSVLADLIRAGRMPANAPALGLLTLGQVVPMISFLPRATRLRGDLAYLSQQGDITWVDVTAPGDGCAFALCDPVAVSGVAPADQRWPLVISAAFTQTLGPARWRELRWRFFRLHFQYLCAFDRPGDYDYFQITAGPLTLATRYAGRAPSKSRISRPLSAYRSTE